MKESGDQPLTILPADNTVRDEALSALVALGFNRVQVQKVLNKLLKEHPNIKGVEELIKLALKQMA